MPTVTGFCLYSWTLNYLTASAAVITAAVEVLVAAVLTYLVFGDTLEWVQVAGGIMILTAIVILARQRNAT